MRQIGCPERCSFHCNCGKREKIPRQLWNTGFFVSRNALSVGRPEIFNSDQGTQFTAEAFTSILKSAGIAISMDGRGRAHDNIFVAPVGHPLWRSVKYEEIYLKEYREVPALRTGLGDYFTFYNQECPHQSLGYRAPAEIHWSC